MPLHRAALAVAAMLLGATSSAHAAEFLSLDDAFRRVVDSHPELTVLAFSEAALRAERDRAAQRPAFELAAEAENFAGTGEAAGVDGLEATLSLASVLERGGKRDARIAVADRQIDALALQREAKRLDLLAEVARRYLDASASAALLAVVDADIRQRKLVVAAANERVAAGGAHVSVRLQAEAALAKAEGSEQRARSALAFARLRLAALWGGRNASFDVDGAGSLALPESGPIAARLDAIARSPEIRRFASEARLREARLQLATSTRSADLPWEVGVRRLQADDDWALMARISIPLGGDARAAPAIRAAEAELAALDFEREGTERALEATLLEASSRMDAAVLQARHIDAVLLPKLEVASTAMAKAYRAGASSYLDWAQVQSEIVAAQRERIEAGVAAQRALIELQRLTGQSFGHSLDNEELP